MVLKDHPTLPPTAVEGWELRPGEFKGFDRAVSVWLFHVQSSLAGYATATMVPAAILAAAVFLWTAAMYMRPGGIAPPAVS